MDELQDYIKFEDHILKYAFKVEERDGLKILSPVDLESFKEGLALLKTVVKDKFLPYLMTEDYFKQNEEYFEKVFVKLIDKIIQITPQLYDILFKLAKIYNASSSEHISFPGITLGFEIDINLLNEHLEKSTLLSYMDNLLCDEKFIEHVKTKWARNTRIKEYLPILKDGLDSHLDKKYTLSTPAFLLVLDYLFETIFESEIKNKHNLHHLKQRREVIINAINENRENFKIPIDLLSQEFGIYHLASKVLAHYLDPFSDPTFPNRHKILHGKDTDYFKNSVYSTRCILILDNVLSIDLEKFKPN